MVKLKLFTFMVFSLTQAWSSTTAPAADVWIFSGQSNMQKIGSSAQRAVKAIAEEHQREFLPIYSAAPGKPIEAWLDAEHKDHKLWLSIVEKVEKVKRDGHDVQGFVWYQGESNVKDHAGHYQTQLTELVKRVRRLTGRPQLPAIVVQIAAATSYSGNDWAAATIREAQRRFARDDDHAAVIAAIDAPLGDYTVHLSRAGAELVAARIAAAADRLAYGSQKAHWGPQYKSAYFATKARNEVIVEFENVARHLMLGDGWMAGFGASVKTTLPEPLTKLEDAAQLGQLADDFIYPSSGGPLDRRRILLVFDQPLPVHARLSYAAARNAQYGPYRRWGLEFGGLQDGSGHHSPAFVLVPIAEAKAPVIDPSAKLTAFVAGDWRQIAVNCVGRFSDAVTSPETNAGVEQNGWRQAWWNPVSAGLAPNLFDQEGRVTSVNFHTGVWYMSPYFRDLKSSDDALMASWCKHTLHRFSGLSPGAKHDLAIYLLQGPPQQKGETPTSHRQVRISVLHIPAGKKRNHAEPLLQRTLNVPANGEFNGYEVVAASKDKDAFRGNVMLLPDVVADQRGEISLAIEAGTPKGDSIRWSDTTLAGVQIRKK